MNLILEDLKRWFKEKWTAQDGSKCGSYEGKGRVKCRPSKKVSGKTPQTWGEMSKKQKKKAVRLKQKAHRKGHQFSSHKTGETWKADKGKYTASVKEEWNPKNKKKHAACKAKIKAKVKVWPSAYASGLMVQCYKKKSKKKLSESAERDEILNYMKSSMKNPLRFYYLLLLSGEPATEAQKTLYNLKFPIVRTANYEIRKKMMKLLTRIIDLMVTDPILYSRLRSLAMGKKLNIDEEMGVGTSAIPAVSATQDGSIETPPVAAGIVSAMPPKKKKRIPDPILKMMFRQGDRP
jgi:hypothetical protein